jgi:hypothetical protein
MFCWVIDVRISRIFTGLVWIFWIRIRTNPVKIREIRTFITQHNP